MPTDYFDFKRFRVYHDQCAMKVGTDGVLLGAWAEVGNARHILDVGCGSGLIALMLAQRTCGDVVGVEVDGGAVRQAMANVSRSPFSGQVRIVEADVLQYVPERKFDCIVSNPPFFQETTLSPDSRRALARHTRTLSYETLVQAVEKLLLPDGYFSVIVPAGSARTLRSLCTLSGFSMLRQTDVQTKTGKQPKRSLLSFVKNMAATVPAVDVLTLYDDSGCKTSAYLSLTADFYL